MKSVDLDYAAPELTIDELGRKHLELASQITPDIFSKFLVAKSTRIGCLSCGSPKLFVPHTVVHSVDPDDTDYQEEDDLIFVTPKHSENTPFRIYEARYEICCQNCGFVALHLAYPVIKWAMKYEGVVGESV